MELKVSYLVLLQYTPRSGMSSEIRKFVDKRKEIGEMTEIEIEFKEIVKTLALEEKKMLLEMLMILKEENGDSRLPIAADL